MGNYYAGEHSLTKATKALWDNKPAPFSDVFSALDRPNKIRSAEEKVDEFQGRRLFAVIRGMN